MPTTINLKNMTTAGIVRRANSGAGFELSVNVPSWNPFNRKPQQTWIPFDTVDTLVNDKRVGYLGKALGTAMKPLSAVLRSASSDFLEVAYDYAQFMGRAGFTSEQADSMADAVKQGKSSQVRGAFGIVFHQVGVSLGLLAGERSLVAAMPTLGALMGSQADKARQNAMTYATLATIAVLVNTASHLISGGLGTCIAARANATYETGVGVKHDLYIELTDMRTHNKTVLPIAYESIVDGQRKTVRVPWEPNVGLPYERLGIAEYRNVSAPAYEGAAAVIDERKRKT